MASGEPCGLTQSFDANGLYADDACLDSRDEPPAPKRRAVGSTAHSGAALSLVPLVPPRIPFDTFREGMHLPPSAVPPPPRFPHSRRATR